MQVFLIHDAQFPVALYGGTERVVWWLAKGLHEKGVRVVLVARAGSQCPYASEVHAADFSRPLVPQLEHLCRSRGAEVVQHYFASPETEPTTSYVVNIGGNGKAGERFLRNTIFVSRNHAERHGAKAFAYNGLDPDEYVFERTKTERLVFCAKASWRVKNVRCAIRIARAAGRPLDVLGGSSLLPFAWRGVRWHGMVGGEKKAHQLASAAFLLFPVVWNEPFGIAVIEALVSGTPVLATPFGALPELLAPEVGRVMHSEQEFVHFLRAPELFSAERCREWCLANFHYRNMTEKYLAYYAQVLAGQPLNETQPMSVTDAGKLLELPRRLG